MGDKISAATLKRFKVEKGVQKRIEQVFAYDLQHVTGALNDDLIRIGRPYSVEQAYPLASRFGKADRRLAVRLEREFKRFCALTLLDAGKAHAPPGAVDMYWHFFILHTESYIEFCERVWGDFKGAPKVRHHYPSTDDTRLGMLRAYTATRALYVDVFGEPELYAMDALPGAEALSAREIWVPASDTSGDSYSGVVVPEVPS